MYRPESFSNHTGGEIDVMTCRRAAVISSPLAGAVVGGAIGFLSTAHISVGAQLAPDISGRARLLLNQQGAYLKTDFGGLYLKNAKAGTSYGTKGVQFDFNEVGLDLKSPDTGQVTAIAAQPKGAFGDTIKQGVELHTAIGAGTGAVLTAAAAYAIVRKNRHKKAIGEEIAVLESDLDPSSMSPESQESLARLKARLEPSRLNRILRKSCIIGSVAVVGSTLAHTAYEATRNDKPAGVAVQANVAKRLPFMKGAVITGPNDKIINAVVTQVADSVDRGETFWKDVRANYQKTEAKFASRGGLDYLNNVDPDVKNIWVVPGIHCNITYINNFMSAPIKDFKPDVIAITGDVYSARKTSGIENDCQKDIYAQTGKIPVALNGGNHDPDNIPRAIGNHGAEAKVFDGVTIVSIHEPTKSTWGPTWPDDIISRYALIAEAGAKVADAACKVTKTTGIRPVVDVHRDEEGYETASRGCASVIISDHGADNLELPRLRAIGPNNTSPYPVYQQIAVTASGADGGITQVAVAERPASGILASVNIKTGQLIRSIKMIVLPDGTTNLEYQKLPKQEPLNANEVAFLRGFSPNKNKLLLGQKYQKTAS